MLNAHLPCCIVDHLSWLQIDSISNSSRSVKHSDVYFSSYRRVSRQHSVPHFNPITTEYTSLRGPRRASTVIIQEKNDPKPTVQLSTETHMFDGEFLPR